uniref:Uncharacterized protein n=1 Tax=Chelonoidis abingdonii TaxID=106734 RepID=A0A8C0H4T7_CHEAB
MAGENQHPTARKSIAAQPPAAPPRPLRSGSSERVTLKKEIRLVSACAIIIVHQSPSTSCLPLDTSRRSQDYGMVVG